MWKAGAGRTAPANNPKAAAADDDEWDTDPNFVVKPAYDIAPEICDRNN